MVSKTCMNTSCSSTSTDGWKKGWLLRSGDLADLCNRCGYAYEHSNFCETFHLDQPGWRECFSCSKLLHCGCISSKHIVEFMDHGGVGCSSCANFLQLDLNKRSKNGTNINIETNDADLLSQHHMPRYPSKSSFGTLIFTKTLSARDVGPSGRLIIPKACAEAHFPAINQSKGIPLKIEDLNGKEWTFLFKRHPTSSRRIYMLEGVTPYIHSMMLQAGDSVIFSRANDHGGKLIMDYKKAVEVTETPPSLNASPCPSQIPKELKGMHKRMSLPCGGSSSKKSKSTGGMICDDPPRVEYKKMTPTIDTKSKRFLLHSEESMELSFTWEKNHELLPSPSANFSNVVIDEHEFEEFDEPPIFGRKAITTSTPSGCSFLVPEKESKKKLGDVLKMGTENKKIRVGESHGTTLTQQEISGLNVLANAALLGDNLGEPKVANTTRNPIG